MKSKWMWLVGKTRQKCFTNAHAYTQVAQVLGVDKGERQRFASAVIPWKVQDYS